ncbi:MAG TPA: hypothetical protein VMS56_06355 [Thermoanaerobaculia bacterium]|nr:hypothetical protein [Thermoanaerobaculia bacterium]
MTRRTPRIGGAGAALHLLFGLLALCAPVARAQQEVEPAPEEPLVVSRALVPVVGHIGGFDAVLWRSDVALYNDSPDEVTVVVSPLPTPELFQMRTLAPGESVVYANVAADSFGMASAVAPLLVQTLARRSVTVFATAYGIKDGKQTPTEIIPVLYHELPLSSVQQLRGLSMNESRRTNVGLVNLGPAPASFTVAIQRLEGRPLATETVLVGAESSVHVPLNQLFPLVTEGTDLTLLVDSFAAQTYAYASVVRNDNHEAVFVQPLIMAR